MADFQRDGYQLFPGCFSTREITAARKAVETICGKLTPDHPRWDSVVIPLSSLSEHRNPGADSARLSSIPFLLTGLPVLSDALADLILSEALWTIAAKLLQNERVVYHFSNVTRKPAGIGPNLTWHRDYPNRGICPRRSEFFRALIPLGNR